MVVSRTAIVLLVVFFFLLVLLVTRVEGLRFHFVLQDALRLLLLLLLKALVAEGIPVGGLLGYWLTRATGGRLLLLGLLSSSELIGDVLELVCQLLVLGFSLLQLLCKAFSLSLLLDFLGLGFLGHSNKLLLQEFNLLALLLAADVDEL